jgi:hypothetical protein
VARSDRSRKTSSHGTCPSFCGAPFDDRRAPSVSSNSERRNATPRTPHQLMQTSAPARRRAVIQHWSVRRGALPQPGCFTDRCSNAIRKTRIGHRRFWVDEFRLPLAMIRSSHAPLLLNRGVASRDAKRRPPRLSRPLQWSLAATAEPLQRQRSTSPQHAVFDRSAMHATAPRALPRSRRHDRILRSGYDEHWFGGEIALRRREERHHGAQQDRTGQHLRVQQQHGRCDVGAVRIT